MQKNTHHKGQSLMEILFAIALFTIGVATIGYLLFDSFASLRYGEQTLQARLLAREGIEAARIIREADFGALEEGTHGLSFTEGSWHLSDAPDVTEMYERTVTIEDVDTELKKIISDVTWDEGAQTKQVRFSTYLSNAEQNTGQARDIHYLTEEADMNASSTSLAGISLQNTGSDAAVLSALVLQWQGERVITEVTVGSDIVFSAASSSPIVAGEEIPLDGLMLAPGTDTGLAFTFNDAVADTDFILTSVFDDQSRKHARLTF